MMAVIGGTASVWGALVGAAVVTVLTDALRSIVPLLIPGAGGEVEIVFFGLLLVAVMIYMPRGLTGSVDRLLGGAWRGAFRGA